MPVTLMSKKSNTPSDVFPGLEHLPHANTIHTPHDKFFKASLSQKAIAADFLKANLPSSLLTKLNMQTLETVNKSYIIPELKELQSDIVYRCDIQGKAGYVPILLLIEHQSSADEQMAFRLLEYTVHLLRDHFNQGHKHLPIVLPLCLYHGETSPYPYSTDLYDCFEDQELARELMFKSFRLIDLTTQSLEQLEQAGLAAMMEVLFKAHCTKQIRTLIEDAIKAGVFARVLEKPLSRDYLHNTLNYTTIFDKEDLTAAEFLTLITEAVPDKREQIMTFREQLQQEGLQKGMQLGIYEAKREDARKMLAEGVSRDIIKRVTELSDVELDAL
jgi:predicted transposase/invertase (TIGR01784 family)